MPARDWQERILFYVGISVKASLQEDRNRDLTEVKRGAVQKIWQRKGKDKALRQEQDECV